MKVSLKAPDRMMKATKFPLTTGLLGYFMRKDDT